MRRFTFSLEKVLETKKTMLEVRQRELEASKRECARQEGILRGLNGQIVEICSISRINSGESIDVERTIALSRYLSHLDTAAKEQQTNVEKCKAEMETRRAIVLTVRKEAKVLDRLKSGEEKRYLKDCQCQLQIEFDDMAMKGHSRKAIREAT